MIERATTSKDLQSIFFKKNLEVVEKWEKFIALKNGQITGMVNSAILEFSSNYQFQSVNISVDILRQITNVNSGAISGFSSIKNTLILANPITLGVNKFKIYPDNWVRSILQRLLGNHTSYSRVRGFTISSPNRLATEKSREINNLIKLFDFAEIRTISFSENTLKVEYAALINTASIDAIVLSLNAINSGKC